MSIGRGTRLRFMKGPRETPPIDLALVDALLRAHLTARRRGCRIRVCNVPPELCELLEFVGVEDLLLLEPRRQAEGLEELRIEEVVQPDDPVA